MLEAAPSRAGCRSGTGSASRTPSATGCPPGRRTASERRLRLRSRLRWWRSAVMPLFTAAGIQAVDVAQPVDPGPVNKARWLFNVVAESQGSKEN